MKKIINCFKKKSLSRSSSDGRYTATQQKSRKAQAGIDYTIRNYGKTLKDLARYDRGEA